MASDFERDCKVTDEWKGDWGMTGELENSNKNGNGADGLTETWAASVRGMAIGTKTHMKQTNKKKNADSGRYKS